MCAPCKVVINEDNQSSSFLLTTIANFMIQADRGDLPQPNDDDDLYEMAKAEVESRQNVRDAAVAMAHKVGASPRWVELIKKL